MSRFKPRKTYQRPTMTTRERTALRVPTAWQYAAYAVLSTVIAAEAYALASMIPRFL